MIAEFIYIFTGFISSFSHFKNSDENYLGSKEYFESNYSNNSSEVGFLDNFLHEEHNELRKYAKDLIKKEVKIEVKRFMKDLNQENGSNDEKSYVSKDN